MGTFGNPRIFFFNDGASTEAQWETCWSDGFTRESDVVMSRYGDEGSTERNKLNI
jgi:hypothetical protein